MWSSCCRAARSTPEPAHETSFSTVGSVRLGSFSTVQFVAYVESVSATYTLFTATGDPLRATCQLSLTEVPLPTKGQNPTSGTLAAQRVHRVVSGDSLESLAWAEYGDATRWRAIARANGIDDPMRLETGRELLLPRRRRWLGYEPEDVHQCAAGQGGRPNCRPGWPICWSRPG